jgi:flavin-dependent dehydrogenase
MGGFNAIAVGGGLAGAAFALELARHGLRVAVIEKSRAAQHKVCGDFHSREAQQLLAGMGIDLGKLGAARVSTFRLVSGKRSATAALPFTGIGLSRRTLDEALLEAAAAAGAEIMRGESASGLELGRASATVRVGARTLTARAVALATGKHNLRGWPRTHGPLTAFKIGFEPTPRVRAALSDVVQLAGYKGGYIGACCIEDGTVAICWLADRRLMAESDGNWQRQLVHIACQSPYFGDLLSGAYFLAKEPLAISAIPFGYRRHDVIAPNVFPVGDQLAVIPSATGDGTSLALASGLEAARAVLAGEHAGNYQTRATARTRNQFRWARALHRSFRTSAARALSIGAIWAMPCLASSLAEATRTRGIERLLVSSAQA